MTKLTNVFITKEDDWYVANSIETDIASQGKTIEEAISNLKEALELYYEDNVVSKNDSKLCFMTTLEVAV